MKKQLQGIIVSNKMQKTVVVEVGRIVAHAKYKKRFRVSKKYKADTAGKAYQVGDVVVIEQCRPLSKDKHWKVVVKAGSAGPQDNGQNETS